MPAKLYLCQCNNCIFVIYLIKAGCTNDSKTVFLSAHINILPNSQSLKSNCQNYSHCTFASRKNGSTPSIFYVSPIPFLKDGQRDGHMDGHDTVLSRGAAIFTTNKSTVTVFLAV